MQSPNDDGGHDDDMTNFELGSDENRDYQADDDPGGPAPSPRARILAPLRCGCQAADAHRLMAC
jgi:hypothetical protein